MGLDDHIEETGNGPVLSDDSDFGEDPHSDDISGWERIKEGLDSGTDKVKLAAAGLAGLWGSQQLTDGNSIVERAPESVSPVLEDMNELYQEKVHGLGREADTPLEHVTYQADKLGHYAVSHLGAGVGCKVADSLSEDYNPKTAALGGMAFVPLYFASKELLYEGRELGDIINHADVTGDLIADTAGAAHGVYDYHKSQAFEDEVEPDGVLARGANAAGKYYQSGKNRVRGIFESKEKCGESLEDVFG